MATAIDMGSGANITTTFTLSSNYTAVDRTNPANATGIINTVQIYINKYANGIPFNEPIYVGTFYESGSRYQYTARAYTVVYSPLSNAITTYTGLNIPVVVGDFLGIYYNTEAGYVGGTNTGGSGVLIATGNKMFGYGGYMEAAQTTSRMKVYATGTTIDGKIINNVFNTKWNGTTISKWNNQ